MVILEGFGKKRKGELRERKKIGYHLAPDFLRSDEGCLTTGDNAGGKGTCSSISKNLSEGQSQTDVDITGRLICMSVILLSDKRAIYQGYCSEIIKLVPYISIHKVG